MSRKVMNTSHYRIMQYWKDKWITMQGDILDEPKGQSMPVVQDDECPCCWGCGRTIQVSDKKDVKDIWNNSKVTGVLQRAHIVPDMLGGSPTEENLFLLCEKCHQESPDTTNKSAFMRWVADRRVKYFDGSIRIWYAHQLVQEQLNKRGISSFVELLKCIPQEKAEVFNKLVTTQNMSEYMKENVGQHGTKVNMNSTVIACADFITKCVNETILA